MRLGQWTEAGGLWTQEEGEASNKSLPGSLLHCVSSGPRACPLHSPTNHLHTTALGSEVRLSRLQSHKMKQCPLQSQEGWPKGKMGGRVGVSEGIGDEVRGGGGEAVGQVQLGPSFCAAISPSPSLRVLRG